MMKRLEEDWAGLCRYREDNAAVSGQPSPAKIVFMGDSITENWQLADPALFSNGIVNRGIGGQTTPQMLVRFRADVLALRPRTVHILAGTNDVAGNTGPSASQDYKNNIMSMVDLARANDVEVVLGSIPPAATFGWRPQVKPSETISALNAWLRDYAASKRIVFIDYHASLAGKDDALSTDLGNDGVHPNRAGYAVMRKRLVAALPGLFQ